MCVFSLVMLRFELSVLGMDWVKGTAAHDEDIMRLRTIDFSLSAYMHVCLHGH